MTDSANGPVTWPPTPGEQRFRAELLLIGAPLFLVLLGGLSGFALTHGGRQFGVVLGLAWLVILVAFLRTPYVAVLAPDGTLEFKAPNGTIKTTADAVFRVSTTGGRTRSYVFHFDNRKATLGMMGGQALARYLAARNPAIERPRRL